MNFEILEFNNNYFQLQNEMACFSLKFVPEFQLIL